jgi:hypothetical protein
MNRGMEGDEMAGLLKSRSLQVLTLIIFAIFSLAVGCTSSDAPCKNTGYASGNSLIDPDNTSWTLQTDPDANKDCHAKFKLEYGFVDYTMSMDAEAADPRTAIDGSDPSSGRLYMEFGTSWGYFPTPASRKVAYEEQGDTKYKWVMELDQGAKNEPGNPTMYYMRAVADVPGGDGWYGVWLRGTINYSKYEPEE